MSDTEQVISNLEKSIKYHAHMKDTFCQECIMSMNMAIALLKEQSETIKQKQAEIEKWIEAYEQY